MGHKQHGFHEMDEYRVLFNEYSVKHLKHIYSKRQIQDAGTKLLFHASALDECRKTMDFECIVNKILYGSDIVISPLGFEQYAHSKRNVRKNREESAKQLVKVLKDYRLIPNSLYVTDDNELAYRNSIGVIKILLNVVSDRAYLDKFDLKRQMHLSSSFAGWF